MNEDAIAPVNQTPGVEGPRLPIKIRTVDRRTIDIAAKLKKRDLIKEQLGIVADVLLCDETGGAVYVE